jgi:flagellar hook-basal body complex protein FliE
MTPLAIAPVAAISGGPDALSAAGAMSAATGAGAPDTFAKLIQDQVSDLNASVGAAEGAMHELAGGKSVELHDVMISLERARLSVQTFVQVRNKLIESYQDLMRMQL